MKTYAAQASGQVKDGPGAIGGVVLTAGADAASVTLYDNTAASGTKLLVLKAAAGTSVTWSPAAGQIFGKGLYATLTGTTPDVFILYR